MKNRHHDGIYQLKPIASITAGMIECTTIHSNEAQNYCKILRPPRIFGFFSRRVWWGGVLTAKRLAVSANPYATLLTNNQITNNQKQIYANEKTNVWTFTDAKILFYFQRKKS